MKKYSEIEKKKLYQSNPQETQYSPMYSVIQIVLITVSKINTKLFYHSRSLGAAKGADVWTINCGDFETSLPRSSMAATAMKCLVPGLHSSMV
jgi:hypothetical protein